MVWTLRRGGVAKVMGDSERRRALRGETEIARGLWSGLEALLVNLCRRKSLRDEMGQEGSTWVTSHWSVQTERGNVVVGRRGEFD